MASQGPLNQTVAVNAEHGGGGTLAWNVYPTYAVVQSSGASGTFQSQHCYGDEFGFSIPSDATINGIVVAITLRAMSDFGDTYAYDDVVYLTKGTADHSNYKAVGGHLPVDYTERSYGASNDLWGATFTPAEVNDAGFGLCYIGNIYAASPYWNAIYLQSGKITVYYTPYEPPPPPPPPSGYPNKVCGVAAASIGKVISVTRAATLKVLGKT